MEKMSPWISHPKTLEIRAFSDEINMFLFTKERLKKKFSQRGFSNFFFFLIYPMRSMGESIGIGLEASSTSTDPQAKTTEPMDSTKVTYCRIQLG